MKHGVRFNARWTTTKGSSPGHAVVPPADEVVAVGAELCVPHGVVVALVAHQAGEGLQAPQPHRPVLGARQQVVPVEKHQGAAELRM